MRLGIIGLGKMGSNIARRLLNNKHNCVVFDLNIYIIKLFEEYGGEITFFFKDLLKKLYTPRSIWIMLPYGNITAKTIYQLIKYLNTGDTIIDGSNANFKDDISRFKLIYKKGINYLDVGVSGGIWGLSRGYCLMIGGDQPIFKIHTYIFESLSSLEKNIKFSIFNKKDYIYCGNTGSGHFVKMIHNGIEYGMMESYAEGFNIMRNHKNLNLKNISEVWIHCSVISSWLLYIIYIILKKDENLYNFIGYVNDSGECRWTINTAIEKSVSAEVLTASLYSRFRSRNNNNYADKLLSAMRYKFGGHIE
ncbi:Probable 6-phosphogluconate dehydrogenase, decarboxylating [Candidatus Johnevansia muelleri]|uniref:Probable 6-phosphogluconate dehydrogenase, decarboxylating n=1 Tax=Candidatus Johnevansia muelleri TaxID=1495769 RepID=A0A078KEE4_9GAMM|nr:Probable 6-phosphogluconate dehydrogenase, decarboxylating [Candidatus Evansia muelleri]